MALDEALTKLAAEQPAKAQLVKLKFFAGLTMPEVAAAHGDFPGDRRARIGRSPAAGSMRNLAEPPVRCFRIVFSAG